MSKHTKGPWMVSEAVPGAIVPCHDTGENLLGTDSEGYAIVMAPQDAILMAAAPELLAAIKEIDTRTMCVCKLNPFVGGPIPCQTCKLKALIEKAEGRSGPLNLPQSSSASLSSVREHGCYCTEGAMSETMKGKTLLKGHALYREGRIRYTGSAQARCQCGAFSKPLESDATRKRWHKQHKEEIRKAAGNE
jgi:hypothetical protein